MREKSEISLRIDRIEDSLYRDLKQLGFSDCIPEQPLL